MHLRILPDQQNYVLKKVIFSLLEWLKTCFDAFAHTYRSPESFPENLFFVTSGVVKHVFLMHFSIIPDHQKHRLKKDIF
jgi:hypothetical protein